MKTMILLFSLFLITRSLQGQKDKFNFADSEINKGLNIIPGQSNIIKIDSNFNLRPNLDLFNNRNSRRFDLIKNDIFQNNLKINHPVASAVDEEFPGASRYYTKSLSLSEMTNEKVFVIKPDTTVKYYLRIKDPLSHIIIK